MSDLDDGDLDTPFTGSFGAGDDADADDGGLTVDDVLEGKALLPEADEEPEEAGDEEEVEAAPEPAGETGAESNPHTVKTLPKDMYVTRKIDGEEETVPIREAVEGGMRQAAYNKKVNEVVAEADRVKGLVQASQDKLQQFQRGVTNILSEPSGAKLDAYMEEHYPEAWENATRLSVRRMMEFHQGTEEQRIERRVERATRAARRQQANTQEQQKRLDAQQRNQQVRDNRNAVVRPALTKAMAQVGSPKLDPVEAKEIQSDMGTMLEVVARKRGRDLSTDEIEHVMLKVLQNHGHVAAKLTPKKRAKTKVAPVRGRRRGAAKPAADKKPTKARKAADGSWDVDWLLE